MSKKKRKKRIENNNGCWECDELICLGEGDHICGLNNELVIDEYTPTEKFMCCKAERSDKQ